MVAEQDDLVVETADMRVAPGAVRVGAPLEDGSGDMKRAGHDAVSLAVAVGADVDQERPAPGGAVGVGRGEADDPVRGFREQVVEGTSLDAVDHPVSMWPLPPSVYPSLRPGMVNLEAELRTALEERFPKMKVVEGLSGGIEPGATVSLTALGLPVKGTGGVLLVFWKST